MDELFFRALNGDDVENYNNGEDIFCLQRYENGNIDCNNVTDALGYVLGHVNGSYLKCDDSDNKHKYSIYISMSSDYDYVATEYAIMQAGNYNYETYRKPIAVIKYDGKVCKTSEDIKTIVSPDFALDLRNGNLNILKAQGIIPGDMKYNADGAFNIPVHGFSGYSTNASELLVFDRIKNDNIKFILHPVMQDLIYSCGIDINKNYNYFLANINGLYSKIENLIGQNKSVSFFYKKLSSAVNLTDIIAENYSNLSSSTIYKEYRLLKEEKINILKTIINYLGLDWQIIDEKYHINNEEVRNKRLIFEYEKKVEELERLIDSQFCKERLVDNKVFVFDTKGIGHFDEKQKHDIVLILVAGQLAKYNHSENGYMTANQKVYKI